MRTLLDNHVVTLRVAPIQGAKFGVEMNHSARTTYLDLDLLFLRFKLQWHPCLTSTQSSKRCMS